MLSKSKRPNLFVKPNTLFNNGIFPITTFKKELGNNNCYITDPTASTSFLSKHKDEIFGYDIVLQNPDLRIVQDPISMDFDNGTFVTYDIETTGLLSHFDHITEIGAVKVTLKDGKQTKVEKFQTFVKQDKPLKPFISKLTHITDEMLNSQGVTEAQAIEQFKAFCGDYPCIGHNILRFDSRFINKKCVEHNLLKWVDRYQIPIFDNCQIDTMEISRAINNRPNHTLRSMAIDANISYSGEANHRADKDAKDNWDVFYQSCIPSFKKLGINNVKDINLLTKQSVIYKQQHHGIKAVIYPSNNVKSKILQLTQQNNLTLENLYKFKDEFILTNNPTSSEIINSFIDDNFIAFQDTLNKYDFISLPPISFWTNLLTVQTSSRSLDLTDFNDNLLWKNRQELAKIFRVCQNDEEKMKKLGASPIFNKLKLNQYNLNQLLSKMDYLTNPLCNITQKGDSVDIVFEKDPSLTLEQLQEAYKKIINTCKHLDKPVVIDNEILIPSEKDIKDFNTFNENNPKTPYKKFAKTTGGCKVWKFTDRELKKELSFLDEKTVDEICFQNPKIMLEEIKKLKTIQKQK